jgi:tRNA nucleotidyltransferase (CCA-adding enzyme)
MSDPRLALVRRLAEAFRNEGARAFVVGGAVRDELLGRPVQEYDLEVYGLAPERLAEVAARFGRVEAVGRSFGVLKLFTAEGGFDLSLPRRESKTGRGHRGFLVAYDPTLGPREASRRRDLTINALMRDPLGGEVLDFHGGRADLEARVLRHTSEAFVEDPLRVLRVMQLAGRLGFALAPETAALAATMDLSELPRERLFDEWKKLLLLAGRPSLGLAAVREMGALRFFPELERLAGCRQDPEWHPEGDVWTHNLLVLDAAAPLRGETERPLALMLGALLHDVGKPDTTVFEEGRWRSPNHEAAGEAPARRFLDRLTLERDLIEEVVALVREHLKPAHLWKERERVTDSAIRRLAQRVDLRRRLPRRGVAARAGRGAARPRPGAAADPARPAPARARVPARPRHGRAPPRGLRGAARRRVRHARGRARVRARPARAAYGRNRVNQRKSTSAWTRAAAGSAPVARYVRP